MYVWMHTYAHVSACLQGIQERSLHPRSWSPEALSCLWVLGTWLASSGSTGYHETIRAIFSAPSPSFNGIFTALSFLQKRFVCRTSIPSLSPWGKGGTRRRGRVEVMSLLTCGLVAKQRSSKSKCRVYLEARAKHTINPLPQTSCSVPQLTFSDILHWLVD